MTNEPGLPDRLRKIAAILVEEGVASHLAYQFGVTLQGEAETIELVRSAPDGVEALHGYMLGIAEGADPDSIQRAATRILNEVH